MIRAPRRAEAGGQGWLVNRRPFEAPAGWRVLVPGWPQFFWGQQQRAWVLLGSYVVAIGAGLLTWGTWVGLSFFAFAFLTHVSSTTDAIRQGSFPIYPRRAALVLTATALALLVYLPALATLFVAAWPRFSPSGTHHGYLVNCWAYHGAGPRRGDWVWLRLPPTGQPCAAQVIAIAGQEVEWTGHQWRIDGQDQPQHALLRMSGRPLACRFQVPPNQVLVEPEDEGASPPATTPLVLVTSDRILGRAWAQFYPVWERRLL
ncbi:MAG TPA: S26 family signal peptidase [Isosphaeraceae bacterium]|nr:S26 family signal peptidase [Isosphaeraceae bacterium]